MVERPDTLEDSASQIEFRSATEPMNSDQHDNPARAVLENKVLFAIVSVACFAAAVAAGTYAVWLSRRKAAGEVLTHVNDLLETCQSRMSQMEHDLKMLSPSA